ncbi:hypothetical protein HY948_02810 [Candidatus Gottesmanbacteria bacterium]|nr:hypothetical protein [Candidatus Gottesmanbacteria bacterium]
MTFFLSKNVSSNTTSLINLVALIIFLPLLLLAAYQTITLVSRATGSPAALVVDAKIPLGPIRTDFYHAFSQGGEESTDMLAPVLAETRALKPKIIRLDHIYDHYDVVGGSSGNLSFSWDKLDAAVNTVMATGAKPLLALSFMPSVIARDGSIINPPNNWDDWAIVVQRTIEHFSGKTGKNLSGVYYEVWNEPDLAQFGSWKLSGDKNYLTLYRYAAIGARNASNVNTFLLGGPSTTGLYKNWIIGLVESGNRLDFLSWHSYLADPKRYNEDQRNIVSWLLPYPNYTLIPKLITEFGFTGDKSTLYGSMYAAAHTAAVVRQLIQNQPEYIFSFQPKDGPNQEKGDGWGFVTHETNGKKPKPRYYVYNFLDAMKGTMLELVGEGSWVTAFASLDNGIIRILIVNFDQNGTHTENVPITIKNLDPGTYTWTERFLLGRDTSLTETITESSLTKELFMPAQSIAIIEITKQ